MSEEYFAKVAKEWDEIRRGYFSETLRDKAIVLAGPRKGETAADIGAGTGFISEGLVASGLKVVAVDESQEMLEVARTKIKGDITFRRGRADSIPLGDETVEYVFANMLLHHVEDPQATLADMGRILKPGGVMVVTDMQRHNFEFLRTEQHDRWMGFEPDQVIGWLAAAGLVEGKVEDLRETCSSKSESGEDAKVKIFAAVARKPARKIIK